MRTYREICGLTGGLIGYASPMIGLVIRWFTSAARETSLLDFIKEDIFDYPFFYSYMFLAAPVIFAVFGFQLGYFADTVNNQKKMLESLNVLLRGQAISDELTGQYNRRHIMEVLEKEIERARRYLHPLSCLMIDIDDFKVINDKYGHLIGDRLLKQTAYLIDISKRKIDVTGRYGGDEFFVILPESTLETAKLVAERIRKNVGDFHFRIGTDFVPLSVSIGLCSLNDFKSVEISHMIEKADQALLDAKRHGKNNIAVSAPV